VRRIGHHTPAAEAAAPIHFNCEHQLRQLGHPVGAHGFIAISRVQVAGVTAFEIALSCGDAADGHHARGFRRAEQRQQVSGQREVAQMVCAEL